MVAFPCLESTLRVPFCGECFVLAIFLTFGFCCSLFDFCVTVEDMGFCGTLTEGAVRRHSGHGRGKMEYNASGLFCFCDPVIY